MNKLQVDKYDKFCNKARENFFKENKTQKQHKNIKYEAINNCMEYTFAVHEKGE